MQILSKILNKLNPYIAPFRKPFLKVQDFSIISNNCWGGFLYQYFGLQYTSPFVGLFIFAPDYIRLLENLDLIYSPLKFINPIHSKFKNELIHYNTFGQYPIGTLGNIEIHFLHYKNEAVIKEKWQKRIARINWEKLIVKFCDRGLSSYELMLKFDKLNFDRKICLTAKQYDFSSCLKLKNEDGARISENEWHSFRNTVNVTSFVNKFFI